MLYKEDQKLFCTIIIYIDDMLIICKEEAIDDAIKVLQGHFQVEDPTSLEDYLGVQIVQSDDGKKAWLEQPTIINSLKKQFGEKVAKKKMTITPGTPGFICGKVDDISNVDEKTLSIYRSGVGTLVYLTMHNRPDITNPARELSKSMDGAFMTHATEMNRVIKCFLNEQFLDNRNLQTSMPVCYSIRNCLYSPRTTLRWLPSLSPHRQWPTTHSPHQLLLTM